MPIPFEVVLPRHDKASVPALVRAAATLAVVACVTPAIAAVDESPPMVVNYVGRTQTLHLRDANGVVRELPSTPPSAKKVKFVAGSLLLMVVPDLKISASLKNVTTVHVSGTVGANGRLQGPTIRITPESAEMAAEVTEVAKYWLFHPNLVDCVFKELPIELTLEVDATDTWPKYTYVRPKAVEGRIARGVELTAEALERYLPLKRVPISYPEEARRLRKDHLVFLGYVKVRPDGTVDRVSIVPHAYQRYFATSIVTPVSQWVFPALPQTWCGSLAVDFKLE